MHMSGKQNRLKRRQFIGRCAHTVGSMSIPALKPALDTDTTVILDSDYTNCGRCIDACDEEVFRFSTRFG